MAEAPTCASFNSSHYALDKMCDKSQQKEDVTVVHVDLTYSQITKHLFN